MMTKLRPFRRLQWQLSLSYTLVTVGALLAAELALFLLTFIFINSDLIANLVTTAMREQAAEQIRPYLDRPVPDLDGLYRELDPYQTNPTQSNAFSNDSDGDLYVLDAQLRLLWSKDAAKDRALTLQPFDTNRVPGIEMVLPAALANTSDADRLHMRGANGSLVVVAPVISHDDERVLGVMVLVIDMPSFNNADFVFQVIPVLGGSLLLFTLLAGSVGTLFGIFTARRLTRRIDRVSQAAGAWSQGDFSTFIADGAGDELGALARRLNMMAEQLQNLMDARQDVAMLEERNRIARELHDSVKQQLFAAVMQLGAAQALLPENGAVTEADLERIRQRLHETERMARMAQSELTHLIQELRPVAMEGKGLVRALRDWAGEWSQQNGIALDFQAQGEAGLSALHEQAIFRVAQEALSNVARHSGAKHTRVTLTQADGRFTLSVADDGRGFDAATPQAGMGLKSMRERVVALGGQLAVESAPGQGTEVKITMENKPNREDV